MKGYYIHFGGERWAGVRGKIKSQVKELRKKHIVEEISVPYNKRTIWRKIYDINPFVISAKYNFEVVYTQISEPDFLYVRAIASDNQYMNFLKRMKEDYPTCKIIVEIPTYPYNKEIRKEFYLRDLWSRRKYSKYVDRIVTYSDDKEIFGVSATHIQNGIDVESVIPVKARDNDGIINIIAVATRMKRMGYERILKGLADYYKNGGKRNIIFHMVGDGPELKKYKRYVNKNEIASHVIFYGEKRGKELDEIYDKADIGATAFGWYKLGIFYPLGILKSREYLAKGLPLINGNAIDIFVDNQSKYSYDFPNNDSIIDIQKIVEFYDDIYLEHDRGLIISEIRKIAYEKVDMSVVMRPVLDIIEGIS